MSRVKGRNKTGRHTFGWVTNSDLSRNGLRRIHASCLFHDSVLDAASVSINGMAAARDADMGPCVVKDVESVASGRDSIVYY